MNDIYAAPDSELSKTTTGERVGGSVEDAIAGNISVSMREVMGEAWRGLKGFKLKCHGASLLIFVMYILSSFLIIPVMMGFNAIGADENTGAIIGTLIQMVIGIAILPMWIGLTVMAIRHSQKKSITIGSLFGFFRCVPRLFLCYVLMTFMIMIGVLLLVLPGIYLMYSYMYAMVLVVEKDMSAWQALETSRKAITKVWFRFFGFFVLIMLAVSLSMIPLGIPAIWVIPWSVLAYAILYVKLFGAEADTLAE